MMIGSVRVCSVPRFALQLDADQDDNIYMPSQATLENKAKNIRGKYFSFILRLIF